jgi:hypothetical protein
MSEAPIDRELSLIVAIWLWSITYGTLRERVAQLSLINTKVLSRISHKKARESLKITVAMPFERSPKNALRHFFLESEIMLKPNFSKHYRDCTQKLVRNAGLCGEQFQ